jgi:dipeptidase E
MDQRILEVAGTSTPSVGWVPSGARPDGAPDRTLEFFLQCREHYAGMGVNDVEMFPLDETLDGGRKSRLLNRDIIHLSGGNPVVFIKNLKQTGILNVLRDWAMGGGILVGESGGAMLMLSSVEIAVRFEHPNPSVDELDLVGMNLCEFEFHPHFGRIGASADELQEYSQGCTVYAAPDGCGFAVLAGKIECFGPVTRFEDGKIVT